MEALKEISVWLAKWLAIGTLVIGAWLLIVPTVQSWTVQSGKPQLGATEKAEIEVERAEENGHWEWRETYVPEGR